MRIFHFLPGSPCELVDPPSPQWAVVAVVSPARPETEERQKEEEEANYDKGPPSLCIVCSAVGERERERRERGQKGPFISAKSPGH